MSFLLVSMLSQPQWELTFADEFNGPAGQAPNPEVWARDLGGGGWGNNELQSYTDGNKNAFMDGQGNLIIEARREPTTGADGIRREFSSARLLTRGNFSQAYGKFEARIKMPKGQGLWPAFWMLGDATAQVGWPAGGEIDIMEYLGHDVQTVHGTIHGPGYSGGNSLGRHLATGVNLYEDFHVYGVIWTPESIIWTFDGRPYSTMRPADVRGMRWPFDDPHYMILNVAVGGNWPGNPDHTTVFPQRLTIDWVRVHRDVNLKVDRPAIDRAHAERIRRFQTFRGAPIVQLPGVVHAVNYRENGYHDLSRGNSGGQYRPLDRVDIGTSGRQNPRYSIGWTEAGEWLEYSVEVPQAGNYRISVEVASEGPGGALQFMLGNRALTPVVPVPDTGGWQAWRRLSMGTVSLPRGRQTLRLVMSSPVDDRPVGNILQIHFER